MKRNCSPQKKKRKQATMGNAKLPKFTPKDTNKFMEDYKRRQRES